MKIEELEKLGTKEELDEYLTARHAELPKESVFQKAIIDSLKRWEKEGHIEKLFLWKNGAGPNGNRNGLPDIMFLLDGTLFGVEVKRPFVGKATDLQKETLKRIIAAGGVACMASYPSDVRFVIELMNYWRN